MPNETGYILREASGEYIIVRHREGEPPEVALTRVRKDHPGARVVKRETTHGRTIHTNP